MTEIINFNPQKFDKMMWIFSNILPTGSNSTRASIESALNVKLDEVLPVVFKSIGQLCKDNPEVAIGYLDFIKQAILFSFELTSKEPEVDYSDSMITQEKVKHIIDAKKKKKIKKVKI